VVGQLILRPSLYASTPAASGTRRAFENTETNYTGEWSVVRWDMPFLRASRYPCSIHMPCQDSTRPSQTASVCGRLTGRSRARLELVRRERRGVDNGGEIGRQKTRAGIAMQYLQQDLATSSFERIAWSEGEIRTRIDKKRFRDSDRTDPRRPRDSNADRPFGRDLRFKDDSLRRPR